MGMPRMHGDHVLDTVGLIKSYCPKCNAIKEWKLVTKDGKYYKSCKNCGFLIHIKDPETFLKSNRKSSNAGKKSKSSEAKKKEKKK